MNDAAKVEGVDYTPEGILEARETLIEWRNKALNPDTFNADCAVFLSHIIAYMADYAQLRKG